MDSVVQGADCQLKVAVRAEHRISVEEPVVEPARRFSNVKTGHACATRLAAAGVERASMITENDVSQKAV